MSPSPSRTLSAVPRYLPLPVVEVEKCPVRLSYADLRAYTDNFSDENYIGNFQFGKVYHGKIPRPDSSESKPVTVKIWLVPKHYVYYYGENTTRLMDEVIFLQKISHPGLMKVYGYCCKTEWCGIVYDFKSFNTVFNLATRDDFKWCQRIKVALRFAQLLRFLHGRHQGLRPLMIRNIDAAHIMVDEDWNPKLYDFSMLSGGPFPDRTLLATKHYRGCYGYISTWEKTQKDDVYAFGVVLLCLIMKEVCTIEEILSDQPSISVRAWYRYTFLSNKETIEREDIEETPEYIDYGEKQMERYGFSLVHKSFEADEFFCARDGPHITRLAKSMTAQPRTMKMVVHRLQKLKVVRRHLKLYIE